jgi:diguanylate cyclase (GGDEF)-like protein
MLFPLKAGPERFGVLALASKEIPRLGNDTLKTLAGAVSHLSLAFKNGVLFTSVKDRADHDGLTRIHNRQHFDQTVLVELKRHQRQGHSLSLLMLDLDHFKSINDTYGHQAGDLVLREMGHLLTTTLRESDYPARYGGEEFVVILPHTSEDQAWNLAERIRRKLAAKRFEHNGHVFRVTTSIGIAGVTPNSLHLLWNSSAWRTRLFTPPRKGAGTWSACPPHRPENVPSPAEAHSDATGLLSVPLADRNRFRHLSMTLEGSKGSAVSLPFP